MCASACGAATDVVIPEDGGSSTAAQTSGESQQSNADPIDTSSASATLAQTGPIMWPELVDPSGRDAQLSAQSELDQAAQNASRAAQQLDACPMLSDATFVASVAAGRTDLPSLEATGARCTWSYPGMSFAVTVEPASDVDTLNHGGRAYNFDVEPVVTAQTGPGANAVLLTDTAFVSTGGDSFDYAYFFVLGEEAVTLRSTGLGMDADSWRIMADEVAANLTDGNGGLAAAAAAETQGQVEAGTAALAPVEPCGYFGSDQVAEFMGIAGEPVTVSVVERGQTQVCTWDSAAGHQLTILARTNDTQGPTYFSDIGATDVSGQVGASAMQEAWRTVVFLPGNLEGLETWHTIEVGGPSFDTIAVARLIASRVVAP